MRHLTAYLCLALSCALATTTSAADWIQIAKPAQPALAIALNERGADLELSIRVATDGDQIPSVSVGWWHGQALVLQSATAQSERQEGALILHWTVPAPPAEITPRLAIAVAWPGGPGGQPRRLERYRHIGPGATHDGLATSPEQWQVLDTAELQRFLEDRSLRPSITIEQVAAGKLTIAIDDAHGRRVRNLISGAETEPGRHTITWDGLDDDGRLVPAGDYRWRSIQHTGIVPDYQFTFANGGETMIGGFGTNHHVFVDATTNGKRVFFASPLTEGGYALIAVTPDGKWLQGYKQIHGTGIHTVACAADDRIFYVAHDGSSWLDKIDRNKANWRAEVPITLTRYNIETGQSIDFPGNQRFAKIAPHEWGPGAEDERLRDRLSLTGMVALDGWLYIASRAHDAILVVQPKTAEVARRIPLADPGALATMGGQLFAVSGSAVVAIDPATGKTTPTIPAGTVDPSGLAAADGRLYVSDGTTNTVRVFTTDGQPAGSYGEPGGAYEGVYRPERLVDPRGLAVLGNRLWVTEHRRNPKRLTGWDLKTGKVVVTKPGNPPYGGAGGGFDPADPSRWIGLRAGWQVDLATGEATCTSVLQREAGHLGGRIEFAQHYRIIHRDGRTFVLGMAKSQIVSELMPDGSLRDLAIAGAVSSFRYACHWQPPAALYEALALAYPERTFDRNDRNSARDIGMLWVDLNRDGECQTTEFQFATTAEKFAGGYWGHDQVDLTFRYPAVVDGQTVLVTLTPDGYHESGAPRYPSLAAACTAGVPIDLPRSNFETSVDRFGNLLVNSSPYMQAFAPDGRELWRYPNDWVGVHGSHRAPLPEPGVMQGNLFFLGSAPVDEQTDAIMTIGNHGRCFVLTSDGLYLDEMFADVRISFQRDEWMVGGEVFGGVFGRGADGTYYLQVGSDGYRIYHVDGFDSLRRDAGSLAVSESQVAAATRALARTTIGADPGPRDSRPPISWSRASEFPVTVDLTATTDSLTLTYTVDDESPWVNGGTDWTLLFKTGDCVDFKFATDPAADPRRRAAAAGDRRLLIAPLNDKPVAVLYDYVAPQAADPVEFASPHRTVKIDRVQRLETAAITVTRGKRRYTVRATIPLADLGLSTAALATLQADLGVVYGDKDGSINIMRNYWSNRETALVNDVPGEAMLAPNRWGTIRLAPGPRRYELVAAGTLGNSGVAGDTLATAGPKAALGLGGVIDRFGSIWDRAGVGQLVRLTTDGRQLASYPLPAGSDHSDAIAATDDWIVILLAGNILRLPVDAPAGTKPEPLKVAAKQLAHSSYRGRVAIATERDLCWLDPATGAVETLRPRADGDLVGIEALPDGSIAEVTPGTGLTGQRPSFVHGYWYLHGWHSTVYRHRPDFRADPGVVLGGNSGHFIGRMDENAEIVTGRNLAHIAGDNYLIGNESGGLHLLRWDREERCFVITRRLGALPSAGGLTIAADGRIYCNRGYWNWQDAADSPQQDGGPVSGLGQGVSLPDGALVMAGSQYVTHPRILYGQFDAPIKGTGNNAPPIAPPPTGAVVLDYENQRHLILLMPTGELRTIRVGPDGSPYERFADSRLLSASPVQAYTSLATIDGKTLLAAGDGAIIAFERAGYGWSEIGRWTSWGDTATEHFGDTIWIVAAADRLWVADQRRHRVLCFAAADRRLISQFGLTDKAGTAATQLHEPTRLSASGDRAVVFDSRNMRLVRLHLQPIAPQ